MAENLDYVDPEWIIQKSDPDNGSECLLQRDDKVTFYYEGGRIRAEVQLVGEWTSERLLGKALLENADWKSIKNGVTIEGDFREGRFVHRVAAKCIRRAKPSDVDAGLASDPSKTLMKITIRHKGPHLRAPHLTGTYHAQH